MWAERLDVGKSNIMQLSKSQVSTTWCTSGWPELLLEARKETTLGMNPWGLFPPRHLPNQRYMLMRSGQICTLIPLQILVLLVQTCYLECHCTVKGIVFCQSRHENLKASASNEEHFRNECNSAASRLLSEDWHWAFFLRATTHVFDPALNQSEFQTFVALNFGPARDRLGLDVSVPFYVTWEKARGG